MAADPCKHCDQLKREKNKILQELVEADDMIVHLVEELKLLEDELETLSRGVPHRKKFGK